MTSVLSASRSRSGRCSSGIWADGKLLRGAAGDLKVGGTLRFYDGSEDQEIDPLNGSIEGIANTPAYRGLALAVFEDLELGEYGNRIPFLTFEIEADEEAPTLASVLGDASAGLIAAEAPETVVGYAAHGRSVKSAIEPLVDCFSIELLDDGEILRQPLDVTLTTISDGELGCSADNEGMTRFQREQVPASAVPTTVRLAHYDAARDYQAGEARASAGERGGTEAQHELAAVLGATVAKSLVQQILTRAWASRDRLTLRSPPSRLTLEPGSRLDLPFSPSRWTLNKVTIDGFVVAAEMRPCIAGPVATITDGGRIIPTNDVVAGPVSIALLDIPGLSPNSPTLLLAASSPTSGWKSAPVELAFAGQNMAVRTAARKSKLGSGVTVLPEADPSSIDTANAVEVQLIDHDQWLTSCNDDALVGGANVALIGAEVIQFGDVIPLGSGRFRLARLLRGRLGTEMAVSSHAPGEIFCMIETGSLQSIPLPMMSIGKEVTAQISGGDSVSVIVSPRADPIPSPSGGTMIDVEARGAIDQILSTLRDHGLIEA